MRTGIRRVLGAHGLCLVFLVALGVALVSPIEAQRVGSSRRQAGRMLREAAEQENTGNLAGSEATLRELLNEQPQSTGAVFALERVLRAAGRLPALVEVLEIHLSALPGATAARFTQVRVLAELEDLSGVAQAVEAWKTAEPDSPDPYREGAKVYLEAVGPDRALDLLREGLDVLGASGPLLIEEGDVYMGQGKPGEAAESWARALGPDRTQTQAVIRRIEQAESDRETIVASLLNALGQEPTTISRLEAGSTIALRDGLDAEAESLIGRAAAKGGSREGKAILNTFARKAEELERTASAHWAYQELRGQITDPVEGRSTDQRLVTTALILRDTVGAYTAQQRITSSYPARSGDRMRSWAQELRFQVALADPATVRQSLEEFRDDFPDSPELDDLAATVASRLLGRGEREVALEVLSGIEGPGANLERAYLLLEAGERTEGLAALEASIPELEPAEATEVISLLLLLSSLGPEGAQLAGVLAISAHRGNPVQGLEQVVSAMDELATEDRPAVLALASRTADEASRGDLSVLFRRAILQDHSDSPEFADAALYLARILGSTVDGRAEAQAILEELIVARPDSPIVPDARRELRRLQDLSGTGGT